MRLPLVTVEFCYNCSDGQKKFYRVVLYEMYAAAVSEDPQCRLLLRGHDEEQRRFIEFEVGRISEYKEVKTNGQSLVSRYDEQCDKEGWPTDMEVYERLRFSYFILDCEKSFRDILYRLDKLEQRNG